MTFNSNGLVQYLVLDSLLSGSKYGLEIIESISNRTNGGYILKKPTLYSCLTRLEKRGYISSSYWGESDLGGKRHYYTITKEGKTFLEYNHSDFETQLEEYKSQQLEEKPAEPAREDLQKPVFLEQKTLFDEPKQAPKEQKQSETLVVNNQMDLFSLPTQAVEEKREEPHEQVQVIEEKTEEKKDDAVFITERIEQPALTTKQEEQNKKLFDTSSELKKYRSKKSFADNQIEIQVAYTTKDDEAETRANIELLKQSLLDAKHGIYPKVENIEPEHKPVEPVTKIEPVVSTEQVTTPRTSLLDQINNHKPEFYTKPVNETKAETVQIMPKRADDAVYITDKIPESQIQYQKRIAPPNIEINVSAENLPAPMRDSKLEPTYKDMVSKIMEKKREKPVEREEVVYYDDDSEPVTFVDYDALKTYYASHGISFKEYKKTSIQRMHNTNFLNFIASAILFLLSAIGSGIIFLFTWTNNLLLSSTNFMYYTIIIGFAVYMLVEFLLWKFLASKKAALRYDALVNWVVFLLASVVVLVVNVMFGMQLENFITYLTSLLIPCYAILLVFPINHHITKFLYKRFAK